MRTTPIMLAFCAAALLSTTAFAQSNAPASGAVPSSAPANPGHFMTEEKPDQWRASKLKGLNVYNSNNEKIGDINELIVDRSGKIEAVVIGVGGFLGMGEHDVAVPFSQIMLVNEPRNAGTTESRTDSGTAGTTGATGTAGTTGATGTASMAGAGATVGSTTAGGSTAAGGTAGPGAAAGRAGGGANRAAPDHAMLNMNKDQLKAAPEFKYAR